VHLIANEAKEERRSQSADNANCQNQLQPFPIANGGGKKVHPSEASPHAMANCK